MQRKIVVAACLTTLFAQTLVAAPPKEKEPSTANLGKKIANLKLQDASGAASQLYELKNKKAIVVVFLSFECPVSNSYSQALAGMHQEYGKHGVAFVGVTVNQDDTRADVAKFVKDYQIPFPVCKDDGFVIANALKADITPECFVLDGDYVLRYRGRIDNSYSERLKKHPQITSHNLKQVLGELLSGRPVAEPATLAVGCPIPRQAREVAKTGDVTYHRDVTPILQKHCQQCHRPGEVGPFALMNYKQAINWAADIKEYTQKRLMPPWKPTEGPAFHNERRLSQKEIDTLAAWVDGGVPEGDPKDAPAPRVFPDGWQLGTPDLVLSAASDFTLGPNGRDLFRCFVMPTNLPEDVYVTAVEVRPSNPRIVHHVLLFVDGTGQGRKLELKEKEKKAGKDDHPDEITLDQGPGYSVTMGVGFVPQGGLSGWAPGNVGRHLPEGSGYFLPKNADVIMQVHFHRNGRMEKDRTQVGLYFAKKKVPHTFQGASLAGGAGGVGPFRLFFSIPAGDENFKLKGEMWATADYTLHSVTPHMHMLGKSMRVTMTPPGGEPQTLIFVKEWDYNWQESYFLKQPIQVKAGTHFVVEATFDNSAKNPNNPFDPPRRITFGEQTFNEMCFAFLGGTSHRPGRGLPMTSVNPKKTTE